MKYFSSTILLLSSLRQASCATYSQTDSHQGTGFLKSFSHQVIADPTHGRVNYVDQDTALAKNLTYASGDHFIIRADHTTVLSAGGTGRDSIRIRSNKQYYNHVVIFNIRHMPEGCATWPAVWEEGADWPNQGEVDIVEGVNNVPPNQSTLHTNSGCTMPSSGRAMTGTAAQNNCDADVNNNAGCGVKGTSSNSFGSGFNAAGGGWYAMERTNSFIKVWFWSRNAGNIPSDVKSGATAINTGNWGTPYAYFPDTSCDIDEHFGWHNIVINLSLCGDWAGNAFNGDGCSGSCSDFVNKNPSAFINAYFDFQWLKIYG